MNIKLDKGAIFPHLAHNSDVGFDIYALPVDIESMVSIGTRYVFDTGLHIQPDPGYYVTIVPNSRLAKTKLYMPHSMGIIDPDYRGSLKVVYRLAGTMDLDTLSYLYSVAEQKQCVAQLIVRKIHRVPMREVHELNDTERGLGGFGSTAETS